MRPQFFKVISGDTFYMGKEGKESEAGSFYLGSVLVASVGGSERRTLFKSLSLGLTHQPLHFTPSVLNEMQADIHAATSQNQKGRSNDLAN